MSGIRRAALLATIVGTFSLSVPAEPALACSCAPPPPDRKALEQAEAVFSGTVVDVRDPHGDQRIISSARPIFFTFDVDGVAKGEVAGDQVVRTAAEGASCGYGFERGRRYLVFGEPRKNGDIATNLCTSTRPLASGEDMPFPEKRGPPDVVPPPGVDEGVPWEIVAMTAAGATLAFAAIVVLRRRFG